MHRCPDDITSCSQFGRLARNLPPPPKIVLALSSEQIHTYITTGGAGGGVAAEGAKSHERDKFTEYEFQPIT